MRLDKRILEIHPDFSRSRIEGLVKSGFVTVNGAVAEKAGMKVSEDDEIAVEIPPPVPAVPEPEDIPLEVVYEDSDMLVIDKAPGMVVHPAPGHFTGTLVNALLHHCPDLSGIGGIARPGIVHRLDQDTSGLIAVAKSQKAMDGLVKAFSSHKAIAKTYLAVCHGRPRLDAGRIENLIGRHPVDRKRMAIVEKNGKVAITNWRVLESTGALSALECRIETGRTHQIRVHTASLGCPVIGDKTYGKSALDKKLEPVPARQMLHAWRLELYHPVNGEKMKFEAPVPDDMRPYLPERVFRRGQALMELAVGMFALALVVSALAGFAVYIAKSLRSQNTVRSSSESSDTTVQFDSFAAKWIFGGESVGVREKVAMPMTEILK
ncbi:MAG: RluA family pseudouridine synthase [Kiritimatiellae bacterium]|nr:RluA family pseudouridine synthase [Kiritimatiellia bacterium]